MSHLSRPATTAFLLTLASNVVTVGLLSIAAGWRAPALVAVFTVLVVGVNYLLHQRLRPYRRLAPKTVSGLSLAVALAGLVLALGWLAHLLSDPMGYGGLIAFFFGGGQLLVTLRYDDRWTRRAGYAAGACAALFFIGLVAVTATGATWGLWSMLAAVVLTPVALGLLAEWLLPSEAPPQAQPPSDRLPPGRTIWAAGALLLTAGIALLLATGVPGRFAFGISAGLLMLTWAITANFVLDVVGVAVAVAVVWSGAPRTVDLLPSLSPSRSEDVVVALGDSFMSGEGASRYFAGTNKRDEPGRNECRRAPTAYVVRAAGTDGGPAYPNRLVFLACSGAKAADIHRNAQYTGEPVGNSRGGLDQLSAWRKVQSGLGLTPKAVVVSVGGNDALFGDIGQACVAPGNCPEIGGSWLDSLARMDRNVDDAYGAIRSAFEGVPVVVVPYPVPLRERSCEWSVLSNDEHRFLNGYTQEINGVLRAAAARHGFHFLAAMEHTFAPPTGMRVCDARDPSRAGVNFFAAHPVEGVLLEKLNPRNWLHNSLHPNARGHGQMSKVLVEWLRGLPGHAPLQPEEARHDVATVEALMGGPFAHCGSSGTRPSSCRPTTGRWVLAQVARAVWVGVWPFLILVAGSSAVSLGLIRWWRNRRGRAA